MAVINTNISCDLQSAVQVQYINGNMFSQDIQANTINVSVTDGGEPATISGTVTANIIRADGGTVTATGGTISGNVASITLPAAAYAVPGLVSIIVKLTDSGVVTTLAAVVANVYQSSTETAVDPGTIIPSVTALVSQIETAVASIPADYSSLWTSLAPAFSTSATYAPGQYVTYDGALYVCTTAHTGSWVAGHFAATNLGAGLSELKSALSNISTIHTNIFNAEEGIAGYYNNSKELAISPETLKHVNIPVQRGDVIRFTVDTTNISVYNIGNLLASDKTPLWIIRGGSGYASYTAYTTYYEITILHDDAAYVAVTYSTVTAGSFMITKNNPYPSSYEPFGTEIKVEAIPDNSIVPRKTSFEAAIEVIPSIEEQVLSSFTPEMTTGKYITINDGTESNLSTGSCSDYIDLQNVTDVYTALSLNVSIYYYNKNKQPLEGFDDEDGVAKWYSLNPPAEAKYVRVSNRTNILSNDDVILVSKIKNKVDELSEKVSYIIDSSDNTTDIIGMYDKVICFGDSLTFSQVYYGPGNSDQRQAFSTYPQILAKLCGIESEQYAVPGDTPKSWWERYYNTAFDDNGLYIVFLGTNGGLTDTIATDCPGTDISNYADTATGYYGRILQSIANTGNYAVLIKIFGGGGESKETTNSVIEQFGTRYNFPVIDVESTERTDRNYHYYPDKSGYNALHFNDLGYAWLANTVKQRINNLTTDDKFKIMRRQE